MTTSTLLEANFPHAILLVIAFLPPISSFACFSQQLPDKAMFAQLSFLITEILDIERHGIE